MNLFLFALLFIGLVFIVVGYIKANRQCPPKRIEYRYVPRNFVEEQLEPTSVTDTFAKMFFENSPILSHSTRPLPPPTQQSDINKYFISNSA